MISSKDNPWRDLQSSDGSFVLQQDRESIDRFSRLALGRAKVIERSIPEPFIGNPESARVVFLALNPGHKPDDERHQIDCPGFRDAMFLNLKHELTDYPFYPLNPVFKHTGAGQWWRERTVDLRRESGLDDRTVSERLMVIEWFPYHSERFARPKHICPSQHYSFGLAKQMIGIKLIVRMRAKELWMTVDPRLGSPCLRNPQCGHITRGNTDGDLFDRIVSALRTDK